MMEYLIGALLGALVFTLGVLAYGGITAFAESWEKTQEDIVDLNIKLAGALNDIERLKNKDGA
jgi:hypothetical protein